MIDVTVLEARYPMTRMVAESALCSILNLGALDFFTRLLLDKVDFVASSALKGDFVYPKAASNLYTAIPLPSFDATVLTGVIYNLSLMRLFLDYWIIDTLDQATMHDLDKVLSSLLNKEIELTNELVVVLNELTEKLNKIIVKYTELVAEYSLLMRQEIALFNSDPSNAERVALRSGIDLLEAEWQVLERNVDTLNSERRAALNNPQLELIKRARIEYT